MARNPKDRQQTWRAKQHAAGRKLYSVWLDPKAAEILDAMLPATGKQKALTQIISTLLITNHQVTNNVIDNERKVINNTPQIINNVTNNAPSRRHPAGSRYMSQQLENHILDLRQQGYMLSEVADLLAKQGHIGATGKPYGTATISKAEQRARRRREEK